MANLSDDNTREVSSATKDVVKVLLRLLYRIIMKQLDKRAEQNINKIEKNNPERIRTADIEKEHIDKFKMLAYEENIKAYFIDDENFETPTLKYDVRDEHIITGIFKQIEEGYKIPDNAIRVFIDNHINLEKLKDVIKNIMPIHDKTFDDEINNIKNYSEQEIISKEYQEEVKGMYDKAFKEVTGKENEKPIDLDSKETIQERIDRLKNQSQAQPPARTDIELTNEQIHLIIDDLGQNNILSQVDVRNIKSAVDDDRRYFILSDNDKEYNIVTDYYSSVDPYGNEFKVVIDKENQKVNMYETELASGDNWVMRDYQRVKDKDYNINKIQDIIKGKVQVKEVEQPIRTNIQLTNKELTKNDIHSVIDDLEQNGVIREVDIKRIRSAVDNDERYFRLSDNGKEFTILTDYHLSVDPYGNQFKVIVDKETQKANMFETELASGDNWVMRDYQRVKDKDYNIDKLKELFKEKEQVKGIEIQTEKTVEMER